MLSSCCEVWTGECHTSLVSLGEGIEQLPLLFLGHSLHPVQQAVCLTCFREYNSQQLLFQQMGFLCAVGPPLGTFQHFNVSEEVTSSSFKVLLFFLPVGLFSLFPTHVKKATSPLSFSVPLCVSRPKVEGACSRNSYLEH